MPSRQCFPLPDRFFCDGAFYVLTSSSLGGSSLTPDTLSTMLQRADAPDIQSLLEQGICLPLFFPGDCALDDAIVVLGDLTEQEDQEWIGRIACPLKIPCGKLLIVCGGGCPEDFGGVMGQEGYSGYDDYFYSLDVPPGEYVVEVLAYVSSMTVDFYFEEGEPLAEWFHQTRPGAELPQWLQVFETKGYIGSLSDELVTYILRLKPSETDPLDKVPLLPGLVEDIGWCGEFEFRRPDRCPLGIPRSNYD